MIEESENSENEYWPKLFLNGIIVWEFGVTSSVYIASILDKSFLLLHNAELFCAKFVNLLRPVVAPRGHC